MVRTAPATASSASATPDGVGEDRGGSGASGVDKIGSAEDIAAAVLVLMNPPVKNMPRAEEAARRCAISAPPRLRRGCSKVQCSVGAVVGSGKLSGK